jgi:hypothetical protein
MLYCIWHLLNDRHRLNADGANLIEQVNHLFSVVSKFVGVEGGDRGIFGFLFFVSHYPHRQLEDS